MPGLERYANQPDEYRHRMVVNVVAALFVIALAASGIWLINALADQRKSQECVLAGHRNCANVSVNGHIRY